VDQEEPLDDNEASTFRERCCICVRIRNVPTFLSTLFSDDNPVEQQQPRRESRKRKQTEAGAAFTSQELSKKKRRQRKPRQQSEITTSTSATTTTTTTSSATTASTSTTMSTTTTSTTSTTMEASTSTTDADLRISMIFQSKKMLNHRFGCPGIVACRRRSSFASSARARNARRGREHDVAGQFSLVLGRIIR
jgi:hypothetical protein